MYILADILGGAVTRSCKGIRTVYNREKESLYDVSSLDGLV